MGDIKFTGSENTATPGTVSQWQNGEFEVVWPHQGGDGQVESGQGGVVAEATGIVIPGLTRQSMRAAKAFASEAWIPDPVRQ